MSYPKFNRSSIVMLICSLVFFVSSLDSSIVGSVLPDIAKTYNIKLIDSKTLLIGFLLSYTLSIPLVEFLVGRYGLRIIFMLSCFGFLISSLLCGMSTTFHYLVISRALQGFSAGCFTPISRAIIMQNSPPEKLAINLTNVQTIGLLGQIFGPSIGSYIAIYLGWPYIFFINIPFCIAIILISYFVITNKQKNYSLKMDILGYMYILVVLLSIMLLSIYVEHDNKVLYSIIAIICTIILIGLIVKLFIKHLATHKQPIINFRLLHNNYAFRVYSLLGLLSRQYLGTLSFIIIIIGGNILHYDALGLGRVLLAFGFGIWGFKLLNKPLMRYFSLKTLLLCSFIVMLFYGIIGIWLLIFTAPTFWLIMLNVFISGMILSALFGYLNMSAYAVVKRENSVTASTISSLIMFLSQSTSIALFAFLYHILGNVLNDTYAIFTANLLLLAFLVLSIVICITQFKYINTHAPVK